MKGPPGLSKMLRGAISGFGEVAAQAHLVGWRSRSEVNIVAIHDPVSSGVIMRCASCRTFASTTISS